MSCFDHLCDQIQNPMSKQEEYSSSPFLPHFPSPFFDQHDQLPFNQILPHHYHHLMSEKNSNHCSTEKETVAKCSANGVSKLKGKAPDQPSISTSTGLVAAQVLSSSRKPKKRTGKKDRHSKIRTAQGIRDRRMRLSLQAARKFFDLQDMLGYDKASRTIEWLFTKSKKAIRELMMNKDNPQKNFNVSTTTGNPKIIDQCEVVSGIIEENFSNNNEVEKLGIVQNDAKNACKANTRESREKARARARCRTREKMMIKFGLENLSHLCSSSNDILEKLGSCSDSPLFEGVDQERVSTYGGGDYPSLLVSHKLADDVGTIEKLLENSNSSTTSCAHVISDHCCDSAGVSCFVDQDSSFMGFFGNWDLFVNNERLNSNNQLCAVTNEVHFGGSPNSVYSSCTTPDFSLFHQ